MTTSSKTGEYIWYLISSNTYPNSSPNTISFQRIPSQTKSARKRRDLCLQAGTRWRSRWRATRKRAWDWSSCIEHIQALPGLLWDCDLAWWGGISHREPRSKNVWIPPSGRQEREIHPLLTRYACYGEVHGRRTCTPWLPLPEYYLRSCYSAIDKHRHWGIHQRKATGYIHGCKSL